MLTVIRKYTGSIIFKILFGLIVVSFAIFFGVSGMQDISGDFSKAPATVNGVPLNDRQFATMLDNQISQLREANQGMDKIPPEYEMMIRQQLLNNLVSRELIKQYVAKNGLEVSKAELAAEIREMESFIKDGNFDIDTYNAFLTNYKIRNKASFEEDVKNDLSLQAFFSHFDDLIGPTAEEVKKSYTLNNTKYKFTFVRVPKKESLDKTDGADTSAAALTKAIEIQRDIAGGSDAKAILEKYKLELKSTNEIDASQIVKAIFGGIANPETLKKVISLSKASPLPAAPLDEGNYYYALKLVDFKSPEKNADDEDVAALTEDYKQNWSQLVESSFLKDLKDKAEIQVDQDLFK